jgi:DNA-binding transcriptional LysR family regulator
MDLNRMHEFVVIARTKSIKKAAGELNLSPATLGIRFHNFEQSLGITLFQKDHLPLELTKEGEFFYKDTVPIVEDYLELKKELVSFDRTAFSSLRIVNLGAGLPFFLGPFLDMINSKYPYMQLDILDDTQYAIKDGLLSGEIDFYFANAPTDLHYAGIQKFLISHPMPSVLLPSGHRLASKPSVSLKELDGERFILYPPTKESCVREFQMKNLDAARIRYSLYEHHSSAAFYELLVPIQKGIILSPTPFLKEPPNTIALPVHDIIHPSASYLFYCDNTQKPEIKMFVSTFTSFIKEEIRHDHTKPL